MITYWKWANGWKNNKNNKKSMTKEKSVYVEPKSVELKNNHIQFLLKIMNMPLHGQEARMRNKFINYITPKVIEIEKERISIMKEGSDKDAHNEPVINSITNQYQITTNREKVAKEYDDLMNETFNLDILPSTREMIMFAKKMIFETKLEFDNLEGRQYDEICEEFEKI